MTNATSTRYIAEKVAPHLDNRTWPEIIEFYPVVRGRERSVAIYVNFPITYVSSSLSFSSFFKENEKSEGIEKLDFASSDPNVAYVDVIAGPYIYAKGPGRCVITIEYGDLVQLINVTVGEQLDDRMLLLPVDDVQANSPTASSIPGPTRSQMQEKALAMKAYMWNATKPYPIWSSSKEYMSTGYHWGLPYTQMAWHDEVEFESWRVSESETRFYRQGYDGGLDRYYGYYGLDCAGFISKCWQLSPKQNTSALARNFQPLSGGIPSVQTGDALLKSGHVMFVSSNNTGGSSLNIVHQTVPETAWRFPSYSEVQNEGYWAISYFFPNG